MTNTAGEICEGDSYTFGSQNLTTEGSYTEVFQAVSGGDSTVTLTLAVNPLPIAGFTFVANGSEVSFTNTSTDASSYLWDFGDGATDIAENPVYTYVSGGSYSVVLTAYSEYCGEVSNTQTVDITTGISSIDFGDLAKIYPNPSTGIFYFEANDLLKDELIVKIVDVNGRVVYENYHITESLEKINLSNYAQGIYFIQLRSDKYSGTEKIVIE